MLLFVLSSLALVAGPLISFYTRHHPRLIASLNGLAMVAVLAGIALHILPDSVEVAGWWVLLLAAAGFVLPSLIEHILSRAAATVHRATLLLAVLGLGLHASLDGLALTHGAYTLSSGVLPAIVVLHRLPVGQLIWALLQPAFGRKTAAGVLLFLVAFTGLGVLVGERIEFLLHGVLFAWFQAFIAGALVHVMLFRSHAHDHASH
ncbi:MAG: hypothetical protein ACQES2_00560 [Pseudomonadota bacterium]